MLSGAEDCRRPIPMVDVAIDRHRPLDLAVLLDPADGHCYIVDYAESLTVVREGMMKPAAYVESDAVLQSELRRLERAHRLDCTDCFREYTFSYPAVLPLCFCASHRIQKCAWRAEPWD